MYAATIVPRTLPRPAEDRDDQRLRQRQIPSVRRDEEDRREEHAGDSRGAEETPIVRLSTRCTGIPIGRAASSCSATALDAPGHTGSWTGRSPGDERRIATPAIAGRVS